MKPKGKNSKRVKSTTNSREYRILTNPINKDHYWDEGKMFYPQNRRGFKNSNRQILSYQVRMYRTWKHNRKKQWKSYNLY